MPAGPVVRTYPELDVEQFDRGVLDFPARATRAGDVEWGG